MGKPLRIVCHTLRWDAAILQQLSAVKGIAAEGVGTPEEFAEAVRSADGVVVSGFAYNERVAQTLRQSGQNVRWLQFCSSGIDAFQRHGGPADVVVCNAASAWGRGVAEHAFAMLLSLSRGMIHLERARLRKEWDQGKIVTQVTGLEGQTAVIIGCGEIGKSIAVRSQAFGMRTIGINRSSTPVAGMDQTLSVAELNRALGLADAVFVCIPLTADTTSLIGGREFEAMTRMPIFINVARGAVVDQKALENALKSGRLRAAGLDVFVQEPLPADSQLWGLENVILSPHISGQGDPNVLKRIAELCAENASRLARGAPLLSQVAGGR
jgi:phosphoglycerate dehydrogenase-like enzyme